MEYNEDEFDPINKSLFTDLNPIINNPKEYELSDLPNYVSYSTSTNYKEFELLKKNYEKEKRFTSIWRVLFYQHSYEISICLIFSLADIFLTFIPSFLLNSLINYLVDPENDYFYGITLCILLFALPSLQTVLRCNFMKFMSRFGLKVRLN